MTAKQASSSGPSSPSPLPRRRRLLLRFLGGLAVLALLVVGTLALGRREMTAWSGRPYGNPGGVSFTIDRGASLEVIAAKLEREGVVDRSERFMLYAWLEGRNRSLQAGEYRFELPVTPAGALEELLRGSFQRRITVPEGWTARQIARLLVQEKWIADETAWLELVARPVDASVLGFALPGGSEGFCFPDTYFFETGDKIGDIHARMLRQFARVWSAASPDNRDPRSAGLSPLEVVTLASMLEREARSVDEMPAIASVYLNRLKIHMRLQCCATVHYALGEVWDRALSHADLKIDSPWNTYRHYGLPPGPIGNPGRQAIEAVLRPADTDFLYYVYRGDGTHEFTRTYREHAAAARRFLHADPNAALADDAGTSTP